MKALYISLLITVLLTPAGCEPSTIARGTPMITAVRRESWQSPYSSGYMLTTKHYRIFTTARSYAIRTYLPGFMEAAYRNYLALTGLADSPAAGSMPIYMLGSRREWAALTKTVLGAGSGALNIEAGGYCHRGICVFWEMGGTGTLSVASHEGLHQFFHHRLRNQLPMWLEEGLCTQAEGYRIRGDSVLFTPANNPGRFNALRAAIVNDRWIPLDRLLPMDSLDAIVGGTERAVGYYGQLWALVQFIRSDESYRLGLERILADAVAGRLHVAMKVPASALMRLRARGRAYNRTVSEPLFRHYIFADLPAFERRYAAFAKKLAKLE